MMSAQAESLSLWMMDHTAWALMNWVPLSSASPSFDCRRMGSQPFSAHTSALGRRCPLYHTSPKPISGSDMWASGAKSPEAPSEPCR